MDKLIKTLLFLILSSASAAETPSTRDATTCTSGTITANNRLCTIECGIDHAGADYFATQVLDFQGCIDACTKDPNCKTAQYLTTNSYCYLKSTINSAVSNDIVNGIVCPDPSSSSSSVPTAASTTSSIVLSSTTGISSSSSVTTTLSGATIATTTSGSSSSLATTTAATTTTTSICNSNSWPSTTTINGRRAEVMCDRDSSGGDYSNLYAPTFQDCENACAADAQCITAQWVASTQYCYLKNFSNGYFIKTGISWIYFYPTTSSSPSKTTASSTTMATTTYSSTTRSTTTTTTPMTSPPTTSTAGTASTSTTSASRSACTAGYFTLNNRKAVVQCSVDYPGSTYSSQYTGSFEPCENLCAADPQCALATYDFEQGYCYLKPAPASPSPSNFRAHAIKFLPTTTASVKPECTAAAIDSPYLLNGGFERDMFDIDTRASDQGRGGPPSVGGFTTGLTRTTSEGCKALSIYPSYPRADAPQYVFGMFPYGLVTNQQYTLSFVIGGYPSLYPGSNTTMTFSVYGTTGGSMNLIAQGDVCTNSNASICPIQLHGDSRAQGRLVSSVFINKGYYELYFVINWRGSDSPSVILDDVQINLPSDAPTYTAPAPTITTTTTTSKPTTTTTALSCIGTYTTISNRTGIVQCGADRAGGDLSNMITSSLQACEQACANNPQCITAQFTGGSGRGSCYMKSAANAPTRASGVDGIVFYNASASRTASPGCLATALPQPFLLNGGFENGYQEYSGNCWRLTNGTSFEGCASCMQGPLDANDKPYRASFGLPYSPLQYGQTYNLSFTIGRPVSDISTFTSPTFTVRADGNRTLSSDNKICGWSDTGSCPITGSGGAVGQFFSTQFTATTSHAYAQADLSQTATVQITWFDTGMDFVLLDNVSIVPIS